MPARHALRHTMPYIESQPAPPPLELLPASPRMPAGAVLISALPATVNMNIYRGDSFTINVVVSDADGHPFNLSGATVDSEIRTSADSVAIAGTFAPSVAGNVITLALLPDVSAELTGRSFVWDVQIEQAGAVTTLAAGTINVTPDVTRP